MDGDFDGQLPSAHSFGLQGRNQSFRQNDDIPDAVVTLNPNSNTARQFTTVQNTITQSMAQIDYTIQNQDTGANLTKSIRSDKELQDEIRSLGTGSFTTNTFNARLQGSTGMKILKYIQSEQFGQHGESLALIETIQVSSPSN